MTGFERGLKGVNMGLTKVVNNPVGQVLGLTNAVEGTLVKETNKVLKGGLTGGVEVISDLAGAMGSGAGTAVCTMMNSCAKKGPKKVMLKKVVYKAGAAASVYLSVGTPVPALPKSMEGNPPKISQGTFTLDSSTLPVTGGMMVPFGEGRPYLFQTTDPKTFGGKLAKESGTLGAYSPNPSSPTAKRDLVHGIMVSRKEAIHI